MSILYYFLMVRKLAAVYVKAKSSAEKIVEKLSPILASPYSPTPWAFNRHFTTIIGSQIRSLPDLQFKREELKLSDGGTVALDWHVSTLPATNPVLFIMPGLTGSSESSYIRHFVRSATDNGFQCVILIYRGLLGLPLTTPQGYSGAWTQDMREAVEHVRQHRPHSPMYAIGYSLGSNILVKYLGEQGFNTPIRAAISEGNPYDFYMSSKTLDKNPFYSFFLTRGLLAYYKKHREILLEHPVLKETDQQILSVSLLRDFDSLVTRAVFNYETVDHYYKDASCTNVMKNVKVPLLCISARDDPVVNPDYIPINMPEENPNVIVVVTERGGHLGFLEGWWPTGLNWADRLATKFLQTVTEPGYLEIRH